MGGVSPAQLAAVKLVHGRTAGSRGVRDANSSGLGKYVCVIFQMFEKPDILWTFYELCIL